MCYAVFIGRKGAVELDSLIVMYGNQSILPYWVYTAHARLQVHVLSTGYVQLICAAPA